MLDLLKDLNEPQRQAVTHRDGPLLVLAGAGSGKTRVITRRVAYLVQQGVPPWQVLAITFTNKAAGEMSRRVSELEVPRSSTVCTFHSLCARLLREFASEAGLDRRFTIYDTSDQLRLAKTVVEHCELPAGAFTPAKVLSAISRAKMHLREGEAFSREAHDPFTRHLAVAYADYQRRLKEANALDFDDLLMRMAFLLRDRPEVRVLLGERYRYVLVDEYQDTNHAQYVIAHGIAMDHENLCVTGDPDQSIYAWRGADVGNILDFEKDYPNALVVRLEENYRSTTPILSAAGRLIAHNRRRKEKGLFTRREGGSDVTVITATDEHAEGVVVVQQLRQLVARGIPHSDVAIFYRLNSLSRVVEDALRKNAVPYRVARGVEFYNRKEIKDVLAYLKLLVNPRDGIACERIINVPARGLGATSLGRLREFAESHGLSLLAAARQAGQVGTLGKAASTRAEEFAQLIDALAALAEGKVRDIVEAVVSRTGMEKELRAAGHEEGGELANVEELISSAAEFDEENPGATVVDYLNQVALVSDVDRMEGSTGSVTLMTLHAAKGLEFPVVFIVGCEDGILPFERAREADPQAEEERRLCFVGITRAMRELFLTHARYRSLRGQRQRQRVSPFLEELDGESVTRLDLSEELPAAAGPGARGGGGSHTWQGDSDPPPRKPATDPWPEDEAEAEIQAALDSANSRQSGGFRPGSRVRHQMFGQGRVSKIAQVGSLTRIVVDFERYGRKTLILQYAKLDLLG